MKTSIKFLVYPLTVIAISLFVIVGCSDDGTVPEPKYDLTLEVNPKEAGNVEGAGQYIEGKLVSISVTDNIGWKFVKWTGDTVYVDNPSSANAIVTMPAENILLTALSEEKFIYGEGVTDIDGNEYVTVIIGNQEWMAENLRVTKYRNGDAIPNPPPTHEWLLLTSGAYCWYNTSYNTFGEIYGALYNFYAVKNSNGLCPTGWHVPRDAEWAELVDYVAAQGYPNESNNPNGAGNALKSCRQVSSPLGGDCATSEHPRWDSHDTHYGFDEFGFSGLPGGQFLDYPYVDFGGIGVKGRWWSSTQSSSDKAWNWILWNKYGDFHGSNTFKYFVYSVRCVRD